MNSQLESTKYMRDLRRVIEQHFDLEELQTIAFDLSIDWGDLSGETKPTKAQNLIMHLARRGRLSELTTILAEERPNINLPQLPPSEQQIKDEKSVTPYPLMSYFEVMREINPSSDDVVIAKAITLTDELLANLRQKKSKGQFMAVIELISKQGLSSKLRPDLSSLNLSNVAFAPGTVNLAGSNLSITDLSGTRLREAHLNHADLSGATLRGTDLSGGDLSGAILSEADLYGANLSGADLSGAKLDWAKLGEADLSEADLSETDLVRADLSRANLSGANLSKGDLDSADLSRANLSGANLSTANLGFADLSRANLRGANLRKANLDEANLREAGLREAINWTVEQLEQAQTLEGAIMPDGGQLGQEGSTFTMEYKHIEGTTFEKWKAKYLAKHGGTVTDMRDESDDGSTDGQVESDSSKPS